MTHGNANRRAVLRAGALAIGALGAGCLEPTADGFPDLPRTGDELELVFEDHFEEDVVDPGVWETEFPWGERIHNFNAYASPNNVYVHEDSLVLEAREERRDVGDEGPVGREGGPEEAEPPVDDGDIVPYTTGVATPYRSFAPGYVEGRIRIPPTVEGFWPAFWLTPEYEWPPEIDVFEFFGADPCVQMTYHYREGRSVEKADGTYCGPDFSADFHEYAVDWRDDRITWYVDGRERFRFEGDAVSTTEMRLILNFGVDAPFVGEPEAENLPAYMEIDRISVWEREAG